VFCQGLLTGQIFFSMIGTQKFNMDVKNG